MKRLLPFALWMLAGCSSDPDPIETTASLPTGSIVVRAAVRSNGSAASVTASVASADDARLLGDGDALVASADDAPGQPLVQVDTFGYAVLLPTQASRITLALVRPAERAEAGIDLPLAFALTVPMDPVGSTDTIPIAWAPAMTADAMLLQVSGACIATPLSRPLASDTGSYALQPGDLAFEGGGCEARVTLSRSQPQRPLDLGAGGSTVTVSAVRTAALEITP